MHNLSHFAHIYRAQGGDVEVLIGTWPKGHFIGNGSDEVEPDELNSQSLFRKKVHRVIMHPKYTTNVLGKWRGKYIFISHKSFYIFCILS